MRKTDPLVPVDDGDWGLDSPVPAPRAQRSGGLAQERKGLVSGENELAGLAPDKSAFRPIDTYGQAHASRIPRATLSPGVEFVPKESAYEHPTVRKAGSLAGPFNNLETDEHPANQFDVLMGAFEHHAPFSTPLKMQTRGLLDSPELISDGDKMGVGIGSPDIMSMVSQLLVGKPAVSSEPTGEYGGMDYGGSLISGSQQNQHQLYQKQQNWFPNYDGTGYGHGGLPQMSLGMGVGMSLPLGGLGGGPMQNPNQNPYALQHHQQHQQHLYPPAQAQGQGGYGQVGPLVPPPFEYFNPSAEQHQHQHQLQQHYQQQYQQQHRQQQQQQQQHQQQFSGTAISPRYDGSFSGLPATHPSFGHVHVGGGGGGGGVGFGGSLASGSDESMRFVASALLAGAGAGAGARDSRSAPSSQPSSTASSVTSLGSFSSMNSAISAISALSMPLQPVPQGAGAGALSTNSSVGSGLEGRAGEFLTKKASSGALSSAPASLSSTPSTSPRATQPQSQPQLQQPTAQGKGRGQSSAFASAGSSQSASAKPLSGALGGSQGARKKGVSPRDGATQSLSQQQQQQQQQHQQSSSSAVSVSTASNSTFASVASFAFAGRLASTNLAASASSLGSLGSGSSSASALNSVGSTVRASSSRREMNDSPTSRNQYKEFNKTFRAKERDSLDDARAFAEDALSKVSEKVRWKILIDLADLQKRRNEIDEARNLYREVTDMVPSAHQAWLDWSRLEEDCGRVEESLRILRLGLERCDLNEGLLTKAIRQHEKLHKLSDARGLLSMLKNESIDKTWRSVLEGALLEARAGRLQAARKLFKLLMAHVPWYGPIYFEAFKLEEKNNSTEAALDIVRRGLHELPRYGPLWFGLLRLAERRDMEKARAAPYSGKPVRLLHLHYEASRAVRNISRELIWKVFFELAQAEERVVEYATLTLRGASAQLCAARGRLFGNARIALVRASLFCPLNLRWKVWLSGARIELSSGNLAKARQLLCQAFVEVPFKSRASVYLECSRVEEYAGNLIGARRILSQACREVRGDWKVFLEAILLRARTGDLKGAARAAEEALKVHAGTGRIWATLVQLCHRLEGVMPETSDPPSSSSDLLSTMPPAAAATATAAADDDEDTDQLRQVHALFRRPPDDEERRDRDFLLPSKEAVLLRALREVPKSGEVWCEGARCRMNPLSPAAFDLGGTQKYLSFAIQFTPQYGDTFVEAVRLEMLCQRLLSRLLGGFGLPLALFFSSYLCSDVEADSALALSDPSRGLLARLSTLAEEGGGSKASPSPWPIWTTPAPSNQTGQAPRGARAVAPAPAPPATRGARIELLRLALGARLHLGLSCEDFIATELSSLKRRCANADPNYGTAWFFSRPLPYDVPAAAIESAALTVAQELACSQALYVRAAAFYIKRCCEKSISQLSEHGPTKASRLLAIGPSLHAPLLGSHADDFSKRGTKALKDLISGQIDAAGSDATHALRLKEFLEDFSLAAASSPSALHTDSPLAMVTLSASQSPAAMPGGTVYCSSDFVTAVERLNRVSFDRGLGSEERRRVLFAGDAILP